MSVTARPLASNSVRTPAILYYLLALLVLILAALGLRNAPVDLSVFPAGWDLHLRDPLDAFQSWVIGHRATHPMFLYFFEPLSNLIETTLRGLERLLLALPWPVHFIVLCALGYRAGGQRVALLAGVGLLIMGLFGLWKASMETFALMGVSVAISLLLGIPLGILAARHNRFEAFLRPLLDAMQTMPAFVYLIPVLLFFGIAETPSVIATVIYALPPAIRLTSLGLRQVSTQTLEAADVFGSTPWQKLIKVQLPLAMPSILLGVNQTIMMALGIVVIAALIGAGGLGLEVIQALQKLKVGQALEAGLAIVFMAVIFDRISSGGQKTEDRRQKTESKGSKGQGAGIFTGISQNISPALLAYVYWATVWLVVLTIILVDFDKGLWRDFPKTWRFSLRGPVDGLVKWMRDNLYQIGDLPIGTGPFSDFLILNLLNPLRSLFTTVLPWPVMVLAVTLLSYQSGGWRLALGGAIGTVALGMLGLWQQSMDTLSQVLMAVALTMILGIPLGIWAARSQIADLLLRPLLDFLQTIPPFVYLVPVIMLFNVGRVPGVIASVLYALPPLIRLTNLGIRQVAPNAIEAADVFGSTPWQKLVKVQVPLALPSIMLGINQTVMMVLSMVIIAGLVGGGALGFEAVNGLASNQLGRGVEAGLAIVILAIILDRITQGWARLG